MEINWLSYVPIYIALCEEKSIAGAAKKLRCSNAHVSRQLRQLEAILSVQLIQRTTRQFNLTSDGQRFYHQVKGLMENVEQINEQVKESDKVAGHLRIAASASFGAELLNPSLIAFRQRFPDVTFEVIFTETPLDLIESGFDLAFFFTDSPPEGYVGHHLRSLHCKPFASKAYLATKPSPSTPEDLHLLEHITYRNAELNLDTWHFHHQQNQQNIKVTLSSVLCFNLVQSILDATVAGCGVAMLDEFALEKLSPQERAQLVNLLPDWHTNAILPLYLLYPKREHLPKRTRAFIEFFKNNR
ncbi:LysR family transcriptional regulator [Vibrio rotiferianus]|uniref:LysR family transcriptional regulator n=1 Tax=Vibrio rotiferianus TaxID=190895 RepID=A0A510IEC1_9VIBR|nr:LysR family transcriptional regulator [Vibrio rotiferianus]TMX61673.1 LysR family transcriptional regulator [Vibrio rotiferianus]BBL91498.1 LysR family transcriptional regulator [Vibrio rotiferianus]